MLSQHSPRAIVPAGDISREELNSLFETCKTECFRLETYPEYRVAGEKPVVDAYMRGELGPPDSNMYESWENVLAAAHERGAAFRRVHIMPERITPYLRYALEWGYTRTGAAGEEVFFLPESRVSGVLTRNGRTDFWLFDRETAVLYSYGPNGEYQGIGRGNPRDLAHFQAVRDAALCDDAISLKDYLRMYRSGELG